MKLNLVIFVCFLQFICGDEFGADMADDPRIYGGKKSADGEFPYLVSLQTFRKKHMCGGAIISDKWIVTAAHCMVLVKPDHILAGTNTVDWNSSIGKRYPVEQIIKYQQGRGDMGLIRVKGPIEFSKKIQSIAYASKLPPAGTKCHAAGWGKGTVISFRNNNYLFSILISFQRRNVTALTLI